MQFVSFLRVQRAVRPSQAAEAAQIIDSGGASISFLRAPPHSPLRLITLRQFQTSPKRFVYRGVYIKCSSMRDTHRGTSLGV